MTLGAKQRLFVSLVPRLIDYAYSLGYELTFGHAWRTDPNIGLPTSNHRVRLAIDFNLFKDGVYLRTTEAHRKLGEFWEGLHELCAWGGHWGDGNHYSMKHEGRR